MSEPHNAFATIAQVLDSNHFGVMVNWGQRVEAVNYRGDTLAVGDRVFIERAPGQWIITSPVVR